MKFFLKELPLNLKVDWKISRGSSRQKLNYILFHEQEGFLGMGEIAPNSYYGDSPQKVQKDFEKLNLISSNCKNIDDLFSQLNDNTFTNSFMSALVQSFISKSDLENANNVKCQTSQSIPILDFSEFEKFFKQFNLKDFTYIKVKIDKNNSAEFVNLVETFLATHQKLRIDANESFLNLNEFLEFTQKINLSKVQFFEQPFSAKNKQTYIDLFTRVKSNQLPMKIILDENITHQAITEDYQNMAHGVNFKFSKSGGIKNLTHQIQQAKKLGLEVMIGCMIETSLGISQALLLNESVDYFDLDGFFFIENEPFKLLSTQQDKIYLSQPFSQTQLSVY